MSSRQKPANAFMQKYREMPTYREWVDQTWGERAYTSERRTDYLDRRTQEGIKASYGNSNSPKKCTGKRFHNFNSRHNAWAAGAKCCSKWKNGQMGFDLSSSMQGEDCGYSWLGNAVDMQEDEMTKPPPPTLETLLKNFPSHLCGNISLISGADFVALPTIDKLYELYGIYKDLCIDGNVEPACIYCGEVLEPLTDIVMRGSPTDVVIVNLDQRLMRMFYEIARPARVRAYANNIELFKAAFLEFCLRVPEEIRAMELALALEQDHE
jgi:hypothetical protein